MKKLIITLIASLLYNFSYGQVYSAVFAQENNNPKIEITVDTSFSEDGIYVQKKFSTENDGDLYDSSSLILLGNFETNNKGVVLDYGRYNYYLLPFNPNEGFLSLNYNDLNNTIGTLYIGDSSTAQHRAIGNPGDLWYFCSCKGEHKNPEGPGGCVSNMTEERVVTCIDDGRGKCEGGCKGEAYTGPYYIINGGGIFVQVSKEKSILYHDFKTGNH